MRQVCRLTWSMKSSTTCFGKKPPRYVRCRDVVCRVVIDLALVAAFVLVLKVVPLAQHPRWAGVVVSIIVGHIGAASLWWFLILTTDRERGLSERVLLFPMAIGFIERLLQPFTLLVGFKLSGLGGGLVGWIGMKLVSGWGRFKDDDKRTRMRAMTAILVGAASLAFAVLGGLVFDGQAEVATAFPYLRPRSETKGPKLPCAGRSPQPRAPPRRTPPRHRPMHRSPRG